MAKRVPSPHLTNEQKLLRLLTRIAEALEAIAKRP